MPGRTVLRQNGRGQRPWSPVQPSPPRPNQVLWERALRSSTRVWRTAHLEQVEHPRAVERPPRLHVFEHHRHQKRRAPPAAKWFRSPCFSPPGRSSYDGREQVQRLKHRLRSPKSLATRSRKRRPKLAAVLPQKSGKLPRTAVRQTSQTPFLKSTNGSQPQSISQKRRRRR